LKYELIPAATITTEGAPLMQEIDHAIKTVLKICKPG